MSRLIPAVALVILTGCALSAPVTDPSILAKCGPEPSEWQRDDAVRAYVQGFGFLDPGSVQTRNVRLTGPRQWNSLHGSLVGWEVSLEVNGKNSFGGYVGFKPTGILILADRSYRWRNVLPQ